MAEVVEREFKTRQLGLKPGGARELLRSHIHLMANQLGVTSRTALGYVSENTVRELARSAARKMRETEAQEDALPPVIMTSRDAGLVLSTFAVAARVGLVNGDTDVAADLCEVVTGVAMELRREEVPAVSALLLRHGLRWASLPASKVATGEWVVAPDEDQPQRDKGVAEQLRGDLAVITDLVRSST